MQKTKPTKLFASTLAFIRCVLNLNYMTVVQIDLFSRGSLNQVFLVLFNLFAFEAKFQNNEPTDWRALFDGEELDPNHANDWQPIA